MPRADTEPATDAPSSAFFQQVLDRRTTVLDKEYATVEARIEELYEQLSWFDLHKQTHVKLRAVACALTSLLVITRALRTEMDLVQRLIDRHELAQQEWQKEMRERQVSMEKTLQTISDAVVTNKVDNVARWEKASMRIMTIAIVISALAAFFWPQIKNNIPNIW